MKKFLICSMILLVPVPSFGQQPSQESNPSELAIGQKLMLEINSGLQCSAQNITLKKELEKVTAELSQLKVKSDAKPK